MSCPSPPLPPGRRGPTAWRWRATVRGWVPLPGSPRLPWGNRSWGGVRGCVERDRCGDGEDLAPFGVARAHRLEPAEEAVGGGARRGASFTVQPPDRFDEAGQALSHRPLVPLLRARDLPRQRDELPLALLARQVGQLHGVDRSVGGQVVAFVHR